MSILYQAISTAIVCYLCLIMGLMYAWPSSTIKLFESVNTTLHRPMDETELALFGSLSSIGAVISTPIAGYLLDVVGRKYCALTGALMHVITWTLLAAWRRVEVLLVAMFLSGLGGSVFLIVPVFVSEICQKSIRGSMTAGAVLFYSTGILTSYLLGGFLPYDTMMYVGLSMAVGAVIMLIFVKESPVFLLQKGREEEAIESIAFFRNMSTDSKEVLEELNVIRRALNPDIEGDDVAPEEEKLKPEMKSREKLSLWKFIRKSRSTRQGLFVCITLCSASIFQGLVAVQVYAEPLFGEAVPSMSPTLCSIILALITVVIAIVTAYLTDKCGRRLLMIYSSVATGVCCALIGTQVHLHWGPHWLTAVFIYAFCISYTFGAGTIPYVLVAEIFLPEVKSFMTMLVIEWAWLCNFILLFLFNPVISAMGLGPVFYIFAIICMLSAVFSVIYLPETKGLPVDAIQTLFMKKRRGRKNLA